MVRWHHPVNGHMSLSKLQEMVKDREAWCATVHRISKSQTWLSNFTFYAPYLLYPFIYWWTSRLLPCPHFSSVQSFSRVWLFANPWIAAHQASLSITNSRSSLRLTSIQSVMPSSHLILCRPLLLLPPIPPSIRVFSNESTLHMRWPKLEFQL